MVSVQKIDLDLFRLLEALYEERSSARAAERLFITPSAVSHALRRLRSILGDELFTRGPHGMVPTPRAHQVAAQLRVLLPQLNEIVSPPIFDPKRSDRRFAVAAIPYLTSTLIPEIAADLATAAPGVRLAIRLLNATVVDDLDGGLLDVALGHFRRVPPQLTAEEILCDPYVMVLRANHPDAASPLTLQTLARLPHIDLRMDSHAVNPTLRFDLRQGLERLVVQSGIVAVEEAMLSAGLRRTIVGHMPDSVSAMAMAGRINALALVPRSAALRFAGQFDLTVLDCPFSVAPLVIQMLTHRQFGDKAAVCWLRERIRQAARSFGASGVDGLLADGQAIWENSGLEQRLRPAGASSSK